MTVLLGHIMQLLSVNQNEQSGASVSDWPLYKDANTFVSTMI